MAVLQHAHAGELAAALAYGGHWRSLSDVDEIATVRAIELEELDHRRGVRAMLDELGEEPERSREIELRAIGLAIAFLCRVGGWFVPMYGAGRLESANVVEYETAARLARLSGKVQFVEPLLEMAEVEWEHERYFHDGIEGHWLRRWFPRWKRPPPRRRIRESFDEFLEAVAPPEGLGVAPSSV